MCGIIGIASNKSVSSNIIQSLKKLEYRGYDSAGIATISNGAIDEKIYTMQRGVIHTYVIVTVQIANCLSRNKSNVDILSLLLTSTIWGGTNGKRSYPINDGMFLLFFLSIFFNTTTASVTRPCESRYLGDSCKQHEQHNSPMNIGTPINKPDNCHENNFMPRKYLVY